MHMPLAIRWPASAAAQGRLRSEYVSFVDFAPTFAEAAGVPWAEAGLAPSPGRSLLPLLGDAAHDPQRDHVIVGQERHDPGRPGDGGYPVRGIVHNGWLYLMNFKPERWPASNPSTGYLNVDSSPTKTLILERRRQSLDDIYWQLCFGKRGSDELYHVAGDPDCLANRAQEAEQAGRIAALRERLLAALVAQNDPRLRGEGDRFDQYPFSNDALNQFFERWKAGNVAAPSWALPGDFESYDPGDHP
jgi:N-sulfoglucosamine sulfohydrolase